LKKPQEASISKTRVIGVFAHVNAGKTTTSEAILYHTGRIHRVGRVDEGSTQLDWMEQERARGITVTAAATTCQWHGYRINLIDTPGHVDFSAEVIRSIRAIDGAVVVVCGVGGVEPQTEAVWRHADRQQLPRIIFVNKLDRVGADFLGALGKINEQLTPKAVALQIPIGCEGEFTGVVDLVRRQALIWHDGADDPDVESIPSTMEAQVASARASLLDAICETDELLLDQQLAGHEPDEASLEAALRRATIAGELVPVLCGSALKRIGVQTLLDGVTAFLPSPTDVPPVQGTVPGSADDLINLPAELAAPFCAVAFKIVTDPYIGHLTWVRVFSGSLRAGEMVYNPRANAQERVGRIYLMHANQREQVSGMAVGDVVGLAGVKLAVTGDTLCDPAHPLEVDTVGFPSPVIMVALAPATEDKGERLHRALARLCEEDPTLLARLDPDTGQETLAGMGELHLEIAVDRLRTEFGIIPQVSQPEIAYRETVRHTGEATGTYKRQTGGHGHYARVHLRVEPLPRGEGVLFENASPPSEIAPQFLRATERGVREALDKGIIAGYPATDLRVTLVGGKFHEVDSGPLDFHIAGSMAVREAFRRAGPGLLEPLTSLNVGVGEAHVGAVTADIGRRRGRVRDISVHGAVYNVRARVPLAQVCGYATDLRSLTQGRGTFVLEFVRYGAVPQAIAKEIIDQRWIEGKIPRR